MTITEDQARVLAYLSENSHATCGGIAAELAMDEATVFEALRGLRRRKLAAPEIDLTQCGWFVREYWEDEDAGQAQAVEKAIALGQTLNGVPQAAVTERRPVQVPPRRRAHS